MHINSKGRKIAIEDHKLEGRDVKCLVIYDDDWSKQPAPMLLDLGTREWLQRNLMDKELLKKSLSAAMIYEPQMIRFFCLGVTAGLIATTEFDVAKSEKFMVELEPRLKEIIGG